MFTLKDAASYVLGQRVARSLITALSSLRGIFSFHIERSNRIARYVEIVRAYKSGEAVDVIAERHGCSRHTVLRYARLANLPPRPKHLPADVKDAVLRDYKRGMPVRRIAELHSVSEAFVSKTAREAGISRRKPFRTQKNEHRHQH
jgi:hypothetical protein